MAAGIVALQHSSPISAATVQVKHQQVWAHCSTLDNVDGQMVGPPVVAVPQLSSGHTTPAAANNI